MRRDVRGLETRAQGSMVRDGAARLLTMRLCEIAAFALCDLSQLPHPEERPLGRVSKGEGRGIRHI
ncbi:hypothetical protein D4Q71_17160 [Rhodopseudomonas palustris]|nr:hypothetical protein B1S06_09455 [Rhodopseudomonas palustris]PPQ43617.1 hypothetical protein CKO39_10470 [Rhodopseudomonas palustris]RJF62584.1 hypothetical protein D4Q71_17160 [Rhodopseudomonas palustris]